MIQKKQDKNVTIELVALLLALGAVVGVLAGLLGIGGGLQVVPALVFILPMTGIAPELVMHFALATSLATIILTSGSSAINHIKLGNVDLFVVKWLIPGVIIGGFLGSFIADLIPSQYLTKVFAVIVLLLALQMFSSILIVTARSMPNRFFTAVSGIIIGSLATLAGIGGGALTVPFLNRHGIEIRKAIGTSAVCGGIIALSGMLGFIWHGTHADNLPPYSIGYVYLPALLCISGTSIFTTKYGARLASYLPSHILKRIFALFLVLISITMFLH
nr:sulfite exporter TauE/SafE family protein [Psychromonas antarctica]